MSRSLKLTIAEFDQMVAKGSFDGLTRKIELIHGAIHGMNPAGPLHDHVIECLNHWSIRHTDFDQIRVRVQSGLTLAGQESRLEPDVLWVRADHPRERHPTADEVLLLIEVSGSSLQVDRGVKADLYAGAGIVEYWVVSIADEPIHVYRQPVSGGYQSMTTIDCGETVTPLAVATAKLDPAELFR